MKKFVITAKRQTGKSTLVEKILAQTKMKYCGFSTLRIKDLADENGYSPVYISPVGQPPCIDDEHCAGACGKGRHFINPKIFDTLGVELLTAEDKDTLIVMDEVGFMEAEAKEFLGKIFEILDSENPVLLMLKDKFSVDYLRKISEHPNVEFITMTEENRDEVFEKVRKEFC